MANITRTFTAGRMNKVVDERLIPNGEYIDALNIRMGSTEQSEIGAIENTKGNLPLTTLRYIDGTPLSNSARCIGAVEDSANETIYWFVHDPNFPLGFTNKLDMIVSFNVNTNILTYHIISVKNGSSNNTTLNFNPTYLITGVNIIGNFLYFTDNYNAPRFINTKTNYANPVSFVDGFTAESILVIKQPPIEAPAIQPIVISNQDNFLETRFICFAYRYEYADGQYSATSQFSAPSFYPKSFNFSIESYLNEGMVNNTNACNITYNTGGPLVKSIDLLFKDADGNIIRVIEKLNKQKLGLADNTEYTYQFSNSKIFTVLPESELLRLYDNVPLLAQAQTIMGNRLMYGNYVEGYDLVDLNGFATKLIYTTELVSETIGNTPIPDGTATGLYDIQTALSVPDSVVTIDLDGLNLVAGSVINLDVNIEHAQFSGDLPYPTETTGTIQFAFTFYLQTDYASAYDLANSTEFQEAIGTVFNISPVSTSCNGTTFTDNVNCALPNTLDALIKIDSGIQFPQTPIGIISSPSSTEIGLQFIAMGYVDSLTVETQRVYEYYKVNFAQATFQEIANPASLHSNRDYEIGIVYMDDFNRSSTALVSPDNTLHIPCGYSSRKNGIRVTIPVDQVAPYWATRYKFVIKPDEENYETIYSSIFFKDPNTNETYFLLEGENARKVEQGDRFIVKADSDGATQTCVYATVLEKESKAENFIVIPSELDPNQDIYVPSGVYMKINTNSFSAVTDQLAVIAPGNLLTTAEYEGTSPILNYPMNVERVLGYDPLNPTWVYQDYTVPAGSRIKLLIKLTRLGKGDGTGACERRIYTLEKTYISSNNYDNMQDWWNGENIQTTINDGITECGGGCTINNVYIPTTATTAVDVLTSLGTNYYKFYRNTTTNYLGLLVTGTYKCSSWLGRAGRESRASADITVYRAETTIVFETEPQDAQPNIWYENDLSFSINASGEHMGNVTNQDIALGIPAVIDTNFFNCFSFGNGVESYKIRDSITGRAFNLGNRVTSVANQDYSEVNRFADITYSGVFNNESNVNKLNEFNLGLLNFKNLEISFGPIYVMDARKTDVLVLQEDKISYVLEGKNLLSDAAGGGALTSVPEVLGTQIARTEKYGISLNPESYVQWGTDRYFTDTKRGAVLQLTGDEVSLGGQLNVVSEMGMRSWFRDLFIESFNTQKLGGFDPYLNEYVLSSNDILIPSNPQCLDCGITQTFVLSAEDTINYCVDLGQLVGEVVISYVIYGENQFLITETGEMEMITEFTEDYIISESVTAEVLINADYNDTIYSSGLVSTNGSFSFNKNLQGITTVNMSLLASSNVGLQITVSCPAQQELKIVNIVLTNNYEAGQSIHAQYKYTDGAFVSPLQSNAVTFVAGTANPLVSYYNMLTGYVGTGGFPPSGSIMTLSTNKYSGDTFNFNILKDKFKYYRSNTLYANTPTAIQSLLAVASTATPNQGGGNYFYANFTVPTTGLYLYQIWDFRDSVAESLCYNATDRLTICCDCEPPELPCRTFAAEGMESETAEIQWIDCNGDNQTLLITGATPLPYNICVLKPYSPYVISGSIGFDLLGDCDV
jgi:hypothetical protein